MRHPTGPELVFAQRMLPHFLAGKSAVEAAEAVMADDARLFTAFCDRSHSQYHEIGDGQSVRTREGKGDVIARHITETVYSRLHPSAPASTSQEQAAPSASDQSEDE